MVLSVVMLHVPLAEVIEKVKEQTGLSEEMIRAQISERTSRLGGLLSEEGAAYILASELGVKIFPDLSRSMEIKVKNITSGLRNVELSGKVSRIFGVRSFNKEGREGIVGSFILADETGEVRVAVWDKRAEWLNNKILEGSKVRIRGAYCKENQGRMELHLNERSLLEALEGAGFDINSLDVVRSPYSLEERKVNELVEGGECKVFGSVVAIYLPGFYYICEQCGKKAVQGEEEFVCGEHGKVKGKLSSRLSFVLDDGSGVLRCVGFRYSAEKLMGFSTDEASNILASGGGEELLRRVNENLLGVEVELFGRTRRNEMSGELDFLVNRVNLNPNPAMIAKRRLGQIK